MNFNNSAKSHQELCDNLRKNSLISTSAIEYAFRKCDRKFFDPSLHPYEDKPHDIGGGATITAAHMHAIALEALGDALIPAKTNAAEIPPKTFLDVGSGSGFVTAAMGHIIHLLRLSPKHSKNAKKSRVFGVDIHNGLIQQSIDNIRRCFPDLVADAHPLDPSTKRTFDDTAAEQPICELLNRDAFSLQAPLPHGPFDAVHCGVAVDFVPLSLLAQLKPGGRLVIPIKLPHAYEQDFMLFARKDVVDTAMGDEDIFKTACAIQSSNDVEAIRHFLDTYFTRKPLLRVVFIMAHDDRTVPTNMPAINIAEKQRQNEALSGFFGANSDHNLSSEDKAKRQAELKSQQLREKEAKILKYQEELDSKRAELDSTSEAIKTWHTTYVQENDGQKPTLKEMQADRHLNNMLLIVKELRVRIAKLERAIISLQSDEANQPKKY